MADGPVSARAGAAAPPAVWAEIAAPYPQKASAMLPVLHEIQSRRGRISVEDEVAVADFLDVPQAQVHEVVAFYDMYSTEKKGKRVVRVCWSIACHMGGGPEVLAALESSLGIKRGHAPVKKLIKEFLDGLET